MSLSITNSRVCILYILSFNVNTVFEHASWTRTQNNLFRKRTLNHLVSLAKWVSVRLRTKWFWVRLQLQSLIGD